MPYGREKIGTIDIEDFLKENCMEERGIECRTLGCFLWGGWDGKDRTNLPKPTCPAHELGKIWRRSG